MKKKFIIWALACVALLIIAMPVIPHHHHSDRYSICLRDAEIVMDFDQCHCVSGNCSHEQDKEDKTDCDATCPTHIHAVKSSSDDHLLFEQVTLQLFNIQISEFVILYLSGNKEFDTAESIHVEKFYAAPPADIRDGRAPPYFNA